MTMQALVIAHAAYGHNHFFKNNYQFQMWTQPDHIIDYLGFAKSYVAECEERYGAGGGRKRARCRACADEPGRQPRSAPAAAQRRQARAGDGGAAAGARGRDLRRYLSHAARDHALSPHESTEAQQRAAPARPARGEPALFPGEERAQARGLAARAAAHRAPAVAVLLSAAPDQDDERRLRHLRALRDHEPAVRARPADRRHHARVPALALLGDLPADLQRSPLQRPQSLRAGLRHDERHPAHLPPSRRDEDRELVPRFRRQRRLDGRRCARRGRNSATRASCCSI